MVDRSVWLCICSDVCTARFDCTSVFIAMVAPRLFIAIQGQKELRFFGLRFSRRQVIVGRKGPKTQMATMVLGLKRLLHAPRTSHSHLAQEQVVEWPASAPTDTPTSTRTDEPTSTPTNPPTSAPTDSPTSVPTHSTNDTCRKCTGEELLEVTCCWLKWRTGQATAGCATFAVAILIGLVLSFWTIWHRVELSSEMHSLFSRNRHIGTVLAVLMLITTGAESVVDAQRDAGYMESGSAGTLRDPRIRQPAWQHGPWCDKLVADPPTYAIVWTLGIPPPTGIATRQGGSIHGLDLTRRQAQVQDYRRG